MCSPVVFTIASRNYAAQVSVLLQSLARFEPKCVPVVIATDGPMAQADIASKVIEVGEFLPDHLLMALYYDAVEFNTAVKPSAFDYIFKKFGAEKVVYLDPDVVLFDSIAPVFEALDHANIALTPHLHAPLGAGGMPDDLTILRSGSFNLGFLGLRQSAESTRFLAWWRRNCRFDCRVDPLAGLFTDQRWIDLAPGLFSDAAILRDPGLNLAYWNLGGRSLGHAGEGWIVDGYPLRFFHFSGYSPLRPSVLSKYQDRIWPEPGTPLDQLLREYGHNLTEAGYAAASATPYAYFTLGDGRKLTRLMRRAILHEVRSGGGFEDPLGARTSLWLDGPVMAGTPATGLRPTRVMAQFLRETEAGAGYRPWASMEEAFALFLRHGAQLGADSISIQAARALQERGDAPADLHGTAPAAAPLTDAFLSELSALGAPAACVKFWRGDAAARASVLLDGSDALRCETMVAYCLGPAAARQAFDAEEISSWLMALSFADLRRLARRALHLSGMAPVTGVEAHDGPFDMADVLAAYGLGPKAKWPGPVVARLQSALGGPDRSRSAVFPLPTPAVMIWKARSDLVATFNIAKLSGRIRFYRWLLLHGPLEYSLDRAALASRAPIDGRIILGILDLALDGTGRIRRDPA